MRKFSLIGIAMLIVSIPTFAGGILTNTNQHVSFLRMLARGASIDIDGVYSNPAGLAFLPEDGLYLSLNGQSAYQTRNIKATFPLFIEDGNTRYYKGKASAPFIPSFQGAYKKGDWTVSGSFAVGGGGGKASFDDGLGMFDSMVMGQIYQAASGKVTPNMYTINSAMVYGGINYSTELFLAYTFRRVMRKRSFSGRPNRLTGVRSWLYFLFPSTSFVMLVLLLYMTTGKNASEMVIAAACGLIFAANVAVLYLLERMEKTERMELHRN